ncbi:hypothetical protein CARUB_v10010785mg [Capsella rubella]|uniref:Uncharacterized protein n=1 Tax=Capsella rubella TaxID=81985 RepID=R0I4N5_9BRAS|nr:hypothetical protein CARUB_v10010785mg [Capsella rubella]
MLHILCQLSLPYNFLSHMLNSQFGFETSLPCCVVFSIQHIATDLLYFTLHLYPVVSFLASNISQLIFFTLLCMHYPSKVFYL